MIVTVERLLEYTGYQEAPNTRGTAQNSLTVAESIVEAYCRGRHVDSKGEARPGVEDVILLVAARLLANPSGIAYSHTAGPFSENVGKGFQGLTLGEQMVLNRYRKRAL